MAILRATMEVAGSMLVGVVVAAMGMSGGSVSGLDHRAPRRHRSDAKGTSVIFRSIHTQTCCHLAPPLQQRM